MSAADNDKEPVTHQSFGEETEAVFTHTTVRGNGKGGFVAATSFNGTPYSGEGWNEQQAQSQLREKVNKAIKDKKFITKR